MNRLCGFLAGLLVVASAPLMAQEQQVWVNVLINGKAVMGFQPAAAPAGQSQRGVCSEVTEAGARTSNGAPIRAFEFTGWKEGERYRVLMFAIVPAERSVASGPCSARTGFKRVEFEDLRVRSGEELTISKMKAAGVTPWVIRAGRKEVIAK